MEKTMSITLTTKVMEQITINTIKDILKTYTPGDYENFVYDRLYDEIYAELCRGVYHGDDNVITQALCEGSE